MNIFFLHLDPKTCAQMHVNKHVVKMILESTQLLCTAHHLSPNKMGYKPPYKLTHKNHPSALWTRESVSNYKWLCKLGKELCIEYKYRYNKEHKSEKYIDELMNNVPDIEDIGFTQPRQAMPDMYKDLNDSLEAYRQYYFFEKTDLHEWKNREKPYWIVDMENMVL